MANTPYERPTISDLGTVEDLTQLTISIKSSKPGTDYHLSKGKVTKVQGNRGVTASFNGGGGATPA